MALKPAGFIAISNAGLLNICNVCGLSGFTPAISYVYDATAKTIVVTDHSTYSGTDTTKIIHVHVTDAVGGVLYNGTIVVAAGTATIDVSTLNPMEGFTITATIVTVAHMTGDLSVYRLGAGAPSTGELGYANKSQL